MDYFLDARGRPSPGRSFGCAALIVGCALALAGCSDDGTPAVGTGGQVAGSGAAPGSGGLTGTGAETGAGATSQGLGGGGPLPDEGTFTDPRDGKSYQFVTIGSQTWMAENLRFETPESQCYGGNLLVCEQEGRLYNLDDALAGSAATDAIPSGVQGVCPAGWHIPSDGEWEKLAGFVLSETAGAEHQQEGSGRWTLVGTKLKAAETWNDKAGTDDYGFRGLAAGFMYDSLVAEQRALLGRWLTATLEDSTTVYFWDLSAFNDSLVRGSWFKEFFYSVRCVRDQ